MSETVSNRYDFVLLFDVRDGNPNGDPDAGNLPRVDPETGQGLVTDVCLKRKVRNYVALTRNQQSTYSIYVTERAVLNAQNSKAYEALDLIPEKKRMPRDRTKAQEITSWMCHNFFDIRCFGAVMTTDVNSGQVRGPVQFTFSRSVDPVVSTEHSITRMAVTTEAEAEKQGGDNRTMGRKFTVPYGVYRLHGFVSAPLAERTGFSEQDLELLWEALLGMFEHDRSAARGEMATRKLIVFEHDGRLGNAPAHELFERVTVTNKAPLRPTRAFSDYEVIVDRDNLPAGVTLLEKR